ncbi:MAG: site-2 protease family protein, partial [Cytophagales bacterium]|nr:site-2 protease family protein [Cytophaga sp.]
GLTYAILFLGILSIHEFGHYYFAKRNNVDASLPYYLPMYLPGIPSIGTFGAFIRMKSLVFSKRGIFDIGIAGPLAGFAAALLVLTYGFATLPEKEYIYSVHPDYAAFQGDYDNHVYTYEYLKHSSDSIIDRRYEEDSLKYLTKHATDSFLKKPVKEEYKKEFIELATGKNILFWLFEKIFAYQGEKIPNSYEMFHYPFLFAGYLALFFTALNLMPIGQLDGGHVIYGLFGYEKHKKISVVIFILFIGIGGVGVFKDNLLGVNFFMSGFAEQIEFTIIYISFLCFLFGKIFQKFLDMLLIAVIVFSVHFLVEFLLPDITGFHGWFIYALLIGRFIGVSHPQALDESPLDMKRKIIGWISLVIFILCFTPEVLTFETITK